MGTFRALDEKWRFEAHDRIRTIVESTAKANGAEVELEISIGYPSVINDADTTSVASSLAASLIGEALVGEAEISLGAEDFGFYTQEIPGCFFRLGTGNIKKGIVSGVHTPTFDIDEDAIKIGISMMAYLGARG